MTWTNWEWNKITEYVLIMQKKLMNEHVIFQAITQCSLSLLVTSWFYKLVNLFNLTLFVFEFVSG